ncbi:MAG: class I SAM-dependent methyltransferase, partial [Deltaproteobacteria bacterium]|nr:class I SAM-dependent methyltransferase [Deltaproteobacteria bacterium]
MTTVATTTDRLFASVERLQGTTPWGRVLDAGTGEHSLRWLSERPTEALAAVTASEAMARGLREKVPLRPQDRLIIGNWTDPTLLAGETFDTVLADYLLGAVDGFAPYFQDQLFPRLRPLVRHRLYTIGLAPYPDVAEDEGGALILELARLRDACILLAKHRCYREYPLDWTCRHLERAGFTVEDAWSTPIVYRERFITGQLRVCESKLGYLSDKAL